ncbi:hypothetical protein KP509_04G012100 [Ceratopteris richardii]|uniref:PWWP domain-containing protein n=1 Tax=Ceratopteris richardii TaxID=49495 RepID=A0A8T2UUL1_CERRI|nr:hypothetical protein KP509_04G012100 [Ceratopteris richardii]KAH7438360.1 hypothetical protein KP509_04G012100 [Ceratopteris richardii]KAH7438361.1 hypothetical protein KP509_04G012100 [Ceratopteris richardii]KAH7438364.1 hypothetical protein KP509_04G012100 [Ceratopteris richardii]
MDESGRNSGTKVKPLVAKQKKQKALVPVSAQEYGKQIAKDNDSLKLVKGSKQIFSSDAERKLDGVRYRLGDMVWGKVKSHPWWPGQLYDPALASADAMEIKRDSCFLVAFFGDSTFNWFAESELIPYEDNFFQKCRQTSAPNFVDAVQDSLDEVRRRVKLGLTCKCSTSKYSSRNVEKQSGLLYDRQFRDIRRTFDAARLLSFIKQLACSPFSASQNMLKPTVAGAQIGAFRLLISPQQLSEYNVTEDFAEIVQSDQIEESVLDEVTLDGGGNNISMAQVNATNRQQPKLCPMSSSYQKQEDKIKKQKRKEKLRDLVEVNKHKRQSKGANFQIIGIENEKVIEDDIVDGIFGNVEKKNKDLDSEAVVKDANLENKNLIPVDHYLQDKQVSTPSVEDAYESNTSAPKGREILGTVQRPEQMETSMSIYVDKNVQNLHGKDSSANSPKQGQKRRLNKILGVKKSGSTEIASDLYASGSFGSEKETDGAVKKAKFAKTCKYPVSETDAEKNSLVSDVEFSEAGDTVQYLGVRKDKGFGQRKRPFVDKPVDKVDAFSNEFKKQHQKKSKKHVFESQERPDMLANEIKKKACSFEPGSKNDFDGSPSNNVRDSTASIDQPIDSVDKLSNEIRKENEKKNKKNKKKKHLPESQGIGVYRHSLSDCVGDSAASGGESVEKVDVLCDENMKKKHILDAGGRSELDHKLSNDLGDSIASGSLPHEVPQQAERCTSRVAVHESDTGRVPSQGILETGEQLNFEKLIKECASDAAHESQKVPAEVVLQGHEPKQGCKSLSTAQSKPTVIIKQRKQVQDLKRSKQKQGVVPAVMKKNVFEEKGLSTLDAVDDSTGKKRNGMYTSTGKNIDTLHITNNLEFHDMNDQENRQNLRTWSKIVEAKALTSVNTSIENTSNSELMIFDGASSMQSLETCNGLGDIQDVCEVKEALSVKTAQGERKTPIMEAEESSSLFPSNKVLLSNKRVVEDSLSHGSGTEFKRMKAMHFEKTISCQTDFMDKDNGSHSDIVKCGQESVDIQTIHKGLLSAAAKPLDAIQEEFHSVVLGAFTNFRRIVYKKELFHTDCESLVASAVALPVVAGDDTENVMVVDLSTEQSRETIDRDDSCKVEAMNVVTNEVVDTTQITVSHREPEEDNTSSESKLKERTSTLLKAPPSNSISVRASETKITLHSSEESLDGLGQCVSQLDAPPARVKSYTEGKAMIISFPYGFQFPTDEELREEFMKFGDLDSSQTKVDLKGGNAQVMFRCTKDAEDALKAMKKDPVFKNAHYRLKPTYVERKGGLRQGYRNISLPERPVMTLDPIHRGCSAISAAEPPVAVEDTTVSDRTANLPLLKSEGKGICSDILLKAQVSKTNVATNEGIDATHVVLNHRKPEEEKTGSQPKPPKSSKEVTDKLGSSFSRSSYATSSRVKNSTEGRAMIISFPRGSSFPTDIQLRQIFAKFGQLDSSRTRVDTKGGYGYVMFRHTVDAEAALKAMKEGSFFENARYWLKPGHDESKEGIKQDNRRASPLDKSTVSHGIHSDTPDKLRQQKSSERESTSENKSIHGKTNGIYSYSSESAAPQNKSIQSKLAIKVDADHNSLAMKADIGGSLDSNNDAKNMLMNASTLHVSAGVKGPSTITSTPALNSSGSKSLDPSVAADISEPFLTLLHQVHDLVVSTGFVF